MDRTTLTFVTVVFVKELPLLLLQAKSMAMHLNETSVSRVYIVDNCDQPIADSDRQAILTQYDHHASSVRFVSVDELGITRKNGGYIRQQLAKLMIAELVDAPWYITLDAKNLFVSGSIFGFLESEGRPTLSRYSFVKHPLRKKLELALDYVGVEQVEQVEHVKSFTPTVTPFAIYTSIAKEMIEEVESKSGMKFEDEFVQRGLTEFFLYGAWMIKRRFNIKQLYYFVDRLPNVWPKMVNDGGLERALEMARATNAPIFTIHRKALARINKTHLERLAQFWVERQLFSTLEGAIAFVEQIRGAIKYQSNAQSRQTILVRLKQKVRRKIDRLLAHFTARNTHREFQKIDWT
jgi:hypothetical protein